MEQAAKHNAKAVKKPARRATRSAPQPAFETVQLATLVDAVPTGNDWMHEIKFDGYRLLASVKGDAVRLLTRTGLDWTERFQPVANALAALDLPPALIDGEVVALDAQGNPSFSALQAALKAGDTPRLAYFAFDLLNLSGEDLKPLPNIERKERLEAFLAEATSPIHVAEHIIGAGEKLLTAMCRSGRRASSPSAPMRPIGVIGPAIGSRSNAPCGRSSS
jgi:bifunctional non-homologous end joining protein LigD